MKKNKESKENKKEETKKYKKNEMQRKWKEIKLNQRLDKITIFTIYVNISRIFLLKVINCE